MNKFQLGAVAAVSLKDQRMLLFQCKMAILTHNLGAARHCLSVWKKERDYWRQIMICLDNNPDPNNMAQYINWK